MAGFSEGHKVIHVPYYPDVAWPDTVARAGLRKAMSTNLSRAKPARSE